jgi:hypothetical protein
MADRLLATRGASKVGQKWPANFVKRTDALTTRFNRAYDRQRALCEDPVLIKTWFELVEQTKAKYGICDDDVWLHDGQDYNAACRDRVREERPAKGSPAWQS